MKKRFLSMVLILALMLCLAPNVFAANALEMDAAYSLYELKLFQGYGNDANGVPQFGLDDKPTREQAITMLIRLLGKEDEAKAGKWSIPFTDVADWAVPYVGYAYANGLTNGTGPTTFDGEDKVTATQYITFVLRALGYSSNTDFAWNHAWVLSDQLGLTDGTYHEDNNIEFFRGDVALISYHALSIPVKDGDRLFDILQRAGVIDPSASLPSDGMEVVDDYEVVIDDDNEWAGI